MNPQILMPTVVSTLHNLFTAVWIGGMIILAMVVLPTLRNKISDGKTRMMIAMSIQNRLRPLAIISMVGLAVTGMLLTQRSSAAGGMFSFATPYQTALSIKHIFMLLMVLAGIVRTIVNKKLSASPAPQTEKTSAVLLVLNIVFGIVVLFLSSLLAIQASMMG